MAVKIRMSRGGSKNRPYYTIVATDSRSPRDSSFIEKLGHYNPTLPKDSAERFKFDQPRVQHWLDKGAKVSDLVARYLVKAGLIQDSKKVIALRDKAKIRQQAAKADKKAAEEAKVEKAKGAEAKAAEPPPVEAKPEEIKPAEAKTEEAAPAEAAPEPKAAEPEAKPEAPAA